MRVRVSDIQALPGLVSHLVLQGFPAEPCGGDEVEVLFPAQPSLFAPAVELDVWGAANDGVTVTPVPKT